MARHEVPVHEREFGVAGTQIHVTHGVDDAAYARRLHRIEIAWLGRDVERAG